MRFYGLIIFSLLFALSSAAGADLFINNQVGPSGGAGNLTFHGSGDGSQWYDSSWQYRVKLTVLASKISSEVYAFPVYVDLSDMPASFFSYVKSDGTDIVVTAADGTTKLSREVVTVNTASQEGELWFAAPKLEDFFNREFYIYYGNAGASETNDTGTWDEHYMAVWHLDDVADSTAYSNGGIKEGGDGLAYVRSAGVNLGTSFTMDVGTPGTNRLVVIMAGDESSGTDLTDVTVNGTSCAHVVTADNTDGLGNHLEMWYIDEAGLGSSSGTVTIAITGGDGGWGAHAHLYTAVDQNGPTDYGVDDTSANLTTITVPGIDVPAAGLVVFAAGQGTGGKTATWTSSLTERIDGGTYDPDSADLASASGIEASAQTGNTYVCTWSGGAFNRGAGVVAVWPEVQSSAGTVAGKVGLARDFDGTATYVRVPHSDSLELSDVGLATVQLWVNKDTAQSGWRAMCQKSDSSYNLQLENGNQPTFTIYDGGWNNATSGVSLTNDQWYFLVGTYDGSDNYIYINAVEEGASTATSISDASSFDLGIGENLDATGRYLDGQLDEVRISDIARPFNWIWTEYQNQNDPGSFYVIGNQETE